MYGDVDVNPLSYIDPTGLAKAPSVLQVLLPAHTAGHVQPGHRIGGSLGGQLDYANHFSAVRGQSARLVAGGAVTGVLFARVVPLVTQSASNSIGPSGPILEKRHLVQ